MNLGSVMSVTARAGIPAYTAAKHGLAGLTKTLAAELGPQGVTVNAMCPGIFETDMAQQNDPEFISRVTQRIPLGRCGVPSELGGAALFLASKAGAYVNGHLLVVDGGMTVTLRSIALRLHGRQPESPRTSLCLESIPEYPDSADPNFANVARLHVWGRAVRAHPNHIARIEGQISGHGADISGHAK